MRYKPEHKAKARESILDAAGRRLKKDGFHGVGVDGLMAEAGLTSGAFYSHFDSKEELLQEVLRRGLTKMVTALDQREAEKSQRWMNDFLEHYFSEVHCKDVERGCILPAMTVDASRSSDEAKKIFQSLIKDVIDRLVKGFQRGDAAQLRARAWSILAIMVGAVTIARAMEDESMGEEILMAALRTAKEISAS